MACHRHHHQHRHCHHHRHQHDTHPKTVRVRVHRVQETSAKAPPPCRCRRVAALLLRVSIYYALGANRRRGVHGGIIDGSGPRLVTGWETGIRVGARVCVCVCGRWEWGLDGVDEPSFISLWTLPDGISNARHRHARNCVALKNRSRTRAIRLPSNNNDNNPFANRARCRRCCRPVYIFTKLLSPYPANVRLRDEFREGECRKSVGRIAGYATEFNCYVHTRVVTPRRFPWRAR